jgi:hypothetical protein
MRSVLKPPSLNPRTSTAVVRQCVRSVQFIHLPALSVKGLSLPFKLRIKVSRVCIPPARRRENEAGEVLSFLADLAFLAGKGATDPGNL